MNRLRRRETTSKLQLPLTHSSTTTTAATSIKRSKQKNASSIQYFMKLAFRLILAFVVYAICMSIYNTRSIQDPCLVAQQMKEQQQIKNKDNSTTIVSSSTTSTSSIPKIIHQQWKNNDIPPKFQKWRNQWLHLFPQPEYTHMLWTDTNGRELIEKHYPWFLETYDGYEHNINRADAARYFILHHYGGIYADLDYEPLINFYDHLPYHQVGMVESPYYWNEKTQNCLMSSPKEDPFWLDLFQELIHNAKKEEVLEATGPILLDQAMSASKHETQILPCENYQRVPLGEYGETLFTTIIDREIMFRLKPISKHCGYYSEPKCHFGKHHNTVSYRTTSGKVL